MRTGGTAASKSALRREMRARLREVSEAARGRAGRRLAERLAEWPEMRGIDALACFLAMPDEIDTRPVLDRAWSEGRRVAVPRWREETGDYEYVWLQPDTRIVEGANGVREPEGAASKARIEDLPLLLIPGRAFDAAGNRLGRGGGHIDRMLTGCAGLRVGVCLEDQIVDDVPVEPHDVPMHVVMTPNGALRRGDTAANE